MSLGIRGAVAACAALLFVATAADADGERTPAWMDSFTTRVEALALLQTLNADLLSHDSATLTLDRWCESHRMASPPHIIAERVTGAEKAPTQELVSC